MPKLRLNTPDATMAVLRVLFDGCSSYDYVADDLGRVHVRRQPIRIQQLRGLNRETADWYRHWKVSREVLHLLEDVYFTALFLICPALPLDWNWFMLHHLGGWCTVADQLSR